MGNRTAKQNRLSSNVSDLEEIVENSKIRRSINSWPILNNSKSRYDQVYPGIFITAGFFGFAEDYRSLCALKITHVLNCAEFNYKPDPKMYLQYDIIYKAISARDIANYDISQHFQKTTDIIDQCLTDGSNILVHCEMGSSRSPTIVAAYLIMCKGFTACQALKTISKRRWIQPNGGFLQQLCELERNVQYMKEKEQNVSE